MTMVILFYDRTLGIFHNKQLLIKILSQLLNFYIEILAQINTFKLIFVMHNCLR